MFVFLFVFFLVAVLSSNYWHSWPISTAFGPGVSLIEYDSEAFENEQSCFVLEYYPTKGDLNKSSKITVLSNQKLLALDSIKFNEKENRKKICFDSVLLDEGRQIIEILTHYNHLYYHIEKMGGIRPEAQKPGIEIKKIEDERINFSVKNFPVGKFAPVEIIVNNKLDHRVYPKEEEEEFNERIHLMPGENNVKVRFAGLEQSIEVKKTKEFTMPFVFGLFLLVLSLFVFCCFVFPEYALHKRLALSLALTSSAFVVLVFLLGLAKVLNAVSFIACFILLLLVISLRYRKKFSLSPPKTIRDIDSLVLFAFIVFVFISAFFHFYTYQHMTYWNGFYERMGSMIREQNSIPELDPLSYFGRGYTFVPGYFLFNAGIAWLTGLEATNLFALIMAFANAFFFLSVYYLGKSLELSKKQSALFSLLIITESFLLTAITLSPRHTLAFSLFILSLALLFDKKNPLLAGFILGIGAFIQAPLLLFFPLFGFIAARKFERKRTLFIFLSACAVFLLLFAPNLLKYGLPYQVEARDWGYLIKVPLDHLYRDFAPLIVFFFLFYFVDLWKKRIQFSAYSKKLFLGIILGFIIQMFVTYRYNIITTLNLGLLLALWFPSKKLQDIHFERICVIFLIGAVWFSLTAVNMFSIQGIAYEPMVFLKQNTSTSSRILTDPLFGHGISYFAERPVLADLHVEYADSEKLNDAYKFLEEKDYSILAKYSIDYTANQSDFINKQAIGGELSKQPIEFRELDKIYSNGFIFIHRNPGEWK